MSVITGDTTSQHADRKGGSALLIVLNLSLENVTFRISLAHLNMKTFKRRKMRMMIRSFACVFVSTSPFAPSSPCFALTEPKSPEYIWSVETFHPPI